MARRLFAFFGLVLLMSCQGRDRPVARADGVVVTERELRQALWERYGAATLQELLVWKIAKSEAQKRGITVSEAEVQNALKSRFSPTTPRHLVETELLLEKLAWAMAEVSEAEARRYFEAHREEFERPERVRLRDITLESKENAEAIYQALRLRNGTNFADLARHFSVNPATRQHGGDMGIIAVRDLHPKLQAVVRKLKVGEFSRPVPLDGEWVIVKLEERMPAERKTFEEVQGQVIASLRRRKAAELKLTLPERWLRQGKVQVLDASLRKSLTLPKGAERR